MVVPFNAIRMLENLRARLSISDVHETLSARAPTKPPLRPVRRAKPFSIGKFWSRLKAETTADEADENLIADPATLANAEIYSANIENMIGTVKVPVGLVGPLRINGLHAHGDYYVPLATTEAALVASYARGADLVSAAGGVSAALVYEGVLRTPGFLFNSLAEAGLFVNWVVENVNDLKIAAESTTRFGKLVSLEPVMDNDVVFLLCRYTTGDASGQNMVTIATDAMCQKIVSDCPVKSRRWYIEANFSGDKKGSYLGLTSGRGRKVNVSLTIPEDLVRKKLHVGIDDMLDYARVANLGALLSGQFGAQAHYANGLAALYIATGQDAACVAESAVGFTRMERRDDSLFVSVTMPNILVGSVGGGTSLPSQSAGLRILGLEGTGNGAALAEVAAALCLCGEISIVAAISAGHFARAHERLARKR